MFWRTTQLQNLISCTFVCGEAHASDSRVPSMPVTSEIWVGLHLSCFGQAARTLLGLDVARALDVIPDAT